MKNPTIATLLNVIPGLGYLYVGGKRRVLGVTLIIATIILFITPFVDPSVTFDDSHQIGISTNALYLILTITFLGGFMYDAYAAAIEKNQEKVKK